MAGLLSPTLAPQESASAAARGGQQATPRRRLLGRFKPSRVHFKMARVWVAVYKEATKKQVFDNNTVAAPRSDYKYMTAFFNEGHRVVMLYNSEAKTVVGPFTAQRAPVSTLRSSVL